MLTLNPIFLPNPYGLYNTGSICYFNSLIQVLISCTSLHEWARCKKKEDNKMKTEFANFIINSNEPNSNISSHLLSVLKKYLPNFGNGQESASEALALLLNTINDKSLNKLFIHRFRYNIKCMSCQYITDQICDHSIQFELFHVSNITKEDILFQKTILSDYKCDKCNHIGAEKISKLTMLPEILVCLFNVYHNKTVHNFPAYLEFPGNMQLLKYMIVGQIEHSGSLNGGHYWSRALRNSGIYLFNDYSYSKSIIEPTKNTYIVVYHLIN